ncbi:MAG: hypothetical protein G3M70_11445 [Candidatus Nitronauta litoralis]|uniref:Hydrazine synthase alpha subunit middle domain-containing protein n=1 Tax=Candidatus Nitronauta litoralis TaxID=2705533 RepID=A0A7T0BX26_9BACT|nr:MAG: hypothetical protein G3M70_11445 [Candidatus Nitronauta litoralis]
MRNLIFFKPATFSGWGIKILIFLITALIAGESLALAAPLPVNYDIVYVRAPRAGNLVLTRIPEVFSPIDAEPGTDLMLLHQDGTEEVLVPGGNGAVLDPYVSFDGQWVYYAKIHDQTDLNTERRDGARSGSDIFKINLQTRQIVQLTFQEFTPNTGVANWSSNPVSGAGNENYLGYGIYNLGPCPLPGGKVIFTSSRNAFMPNKLLLFPNTQLFVMDDDGKNVTQVGHHNLGGALHPTILKDGRVMFSSYEAQGLRHVRLWSLLSIYPDGRNTSPLMSSFPGQSNTALHFQTQLSDGSIVVTEYYSQFNNGFGTLLKFPVEIPQGAVRFGSPNSEDNPYIQMGWFPTGDFAYNRYPFMPYGLESLTRFTWPHDEASPFIDGVSSVRAGKVTQPSGASNNDLLLVWTPGPANEKNRPINTPYYDAGLYVITGGGPVNYPNEMLLIKNDPAYNEQQPRAVQTYQEIYGVNEPTEIPWLPNDGTLSAELPEGTPYGLVGTSSLYKRDTKPGNGNPNFDGLDAFNTFSDQTTRNWIRQGADAGKYDNSDIFAVRLVTIDPTSHISYGPNHVGHFSRNYISVGAERMRILGEIALRKFDAQGNLIFDPEGNPDTSFLAKVPADTPFTFQTIDKNGMVLNMSQTWHQVRPGEILTSCGGCHAHSQEPLDFSQTAAAKPEYVIPDLANNTPFIFSDGNGNSFEFPIPAPVIDLEYYRNIKPILERSCVQCHSVNGPAEAGLVLDDVFLVNGVDNTYHRLANDYQGIYGFPPLTYPFGWNQGNQSRYIRSFQSRRSLLMWKLYGQRLDGWTNADHPSASAPGDPSTLPNGGTTVEEIEQADIDYQGTIMPPPGSGVPPLTETEKMIIARWIDLGSPVTMADPYFAQSGFFADELRPTLFLSTPRGRQNSGAMTRIRFSAFDYYSQLDPNFSVTLNFVVPGSGRPAGANLADLFVEVDDHIWEYQFPSSIANVPDGEIVIEVQDLYGNKTKIKRNFSFGGGGGADLDRVHGWRDLNQDP